MRKIIAGILALFGILLILAGLGLISFEKVFLLYFGGAILILSLFFFLRG